MDCSNSKYVVNKSKKTGFLESIEQFVILDFLLKVNINILQEFGCEFKKSQLK